ncbi:MAG: methyltransferase [Planctomycetaceae bacterium]
MPRFNLSLKNSRTVEPLRVSAKGDGASKESLLLEAVDEVLGHRVLCTSLRRGQFAAAVADQSPDNQVSCFFLDVFLAKQTLDEIGKSRPNVTVLCESDFPEGPFDTVALPFLKNGEAELTRELMQQAHERLDIGGRLIVSTDNPNDTWLHEQLQMLFEKVTKRVQPRGVLYLAMKSHALRRVRDFTSIFTFRDGKRLVQAASRPSVFSHRKLDVGSRALLEATFNARSVQPGHRILDLGCGSGTVGIALAQRQPGVHVHAVDSNPRALQCTLHGAELNGLMVVNQPVNPVDKEESFTTDERSMLSIQLDATGHVRYPGTFDLVVANPPYYSNWAITAIFVEAAARALKPGGRLFLVTKHSNWYRNNLPFVLSDVEIHPVRDYSIVTARKRPS